MSTRQPPSLLVALAALGFTACTDGRAEARDVAAAPRPVELATVTSSPFADPIVATGTIGGSEEIPLSFKVGGLLEHVSANESQQVAAGQILARLSPVEIDAAANKAAEARAKAQRDVHRVQQLHADSVATTVQLQDASTALAIAEQDVSAADFNRSLSVIRAPAAGVVLRRLTDPGVIVAPGTPVLVFRNDSRGLVFRANLADRDAVRVRAGDRVDVTIDAFPGRVMRGRVSTVAAASTPGTGTFEVEIALPAQQGLASGLIGRARIFVQSRGRWPRLPLDAVVEAHGDTAIVYVVPEGSSHATRRLVVLAELQADGYAAVTDGLVDGERVVIRGGAWLVDGSEVTTARVTK
jgi:RND family efflux transporter MFP subunit